MDQTAHEHRIARALVQSLESLERAGVKQIGKVSAITATVPVGAARSSAASAHQSQRGKAASAATRTTAPPVQPTVSRPAAAGSKKQSPVNAPSTPRPLLGELELLGTDLPIDQRAAALQVLRQEVAGCTRCKVLADTRTQTVFGVGNIKPRLCFFGEAPGADEDEQGEPFVGRAGQLLNNIIKACRMTREEVYILNTLKCRPPGNRNPDPDEVSNCRGYFERQLEILRPEFICCLGSVAAKALLQTETSIGKLRGKFHDYHGIRVICTYHPAYLLRNPAAKRDVWEDMKVLMRAMGVELE